MSQYTYDCKYSITLIKKTIMKTFQNIEEMVATFPGCTNDILVCQNCCSSNGNFCMIGSKSSQYQWCQLLVCRNCSNHWYLCTSCTLQRQMGKSNLRYHDKTYHKLKHPDTSNSIIKSLISQTSLSDENDYFYPDFHDEIFNTIDTYNNNTTSILNHSNYQYEDSTIISNTFFPDTISKFSHWQQKKLSLEYLMGFSNFHQMENYDSIDNYDAQYNLRFFEFVTSLSKPLQEDFCDIINGMRPYMLKSSDSQITPLNVTAYENDSKRHILLPHTYNDLRHIYLLGKKSMIESIPQVPVLTIGKGSELHSYVSIKKYIQHFFLFGGFGMSHLSKQSPHTVTSIYESKRCIHLTNEASRNLLPNKSNINILPFVIFSDDFDPSASLVKANRRGIWLYSCTFKNQLNNGNEISTTYVLSIGNKGANHTQVLTLIEEEINEVRQGMINECFHGTFNVHIHPVAIPLLRHGDQPERRSINMLKLGKETNHARWRYSLNISLVKDSLSSCEMCYRRINNHLKTHSDFSENDNVILSFNCRVCSNWSFDSSYEFLHSNPPPDFPVCEIPNNRKLPPLLLNKSILRNALEKTHQKISGGNWTLANGKSYLAYHCFNTSTINKILDAANNCNNLRIAMNSTVRDQNLDYIINDSMKYPDKYTRFTPSHIVNSSKDDLDSFPDTPMHIISGFVKAIINQLIIFLKRKSCYYSYFKMIAQDKTIECLHGMKLSWLKILPFSSEKFAGYACENYIHLSHLFKFIAFSLQNLRMPGPTVFPSSPQSNWTAEINRKWLLLRGLNTKGNAKCLRERVREYMSKEKVVEVEKIHLLNVTDIVRMLVSCNNCIHLLLIPKTSKMIIDRAHLSLIRALNDIHKVDKLLRANQKNPIWYVKYNLICLLNCIENMKEFGPTKYRWEGSMEGEKCIQYLKKYFTGYTKRYQIHLHKKYNLRQSIHNLKRINNIGTEKNINKESKLYVTYKNILEITSSIMRHRPLSLVKFKPNIGTTSCDLGFIVRGNQFYALRGCTFFKEENNAFLFHLENFSRLDDFSGYELNKNNIEDYLVAIPYIISSDTDYNLYYMFSKDGRELTNEFKLSYTNL